MIKSMNIEEIKKHGAALGLEAELTVRITLLKSAQEKRNWAGIRSTAMFIADLAEELRMLETEPRHTKD
jgi:hypothetical protein